MPSPLAYALSAGQPLVPSSKAQIAPADVLGAYQMSTNQANQQYLAKLQQQNSLWGGLAGLGGSALTASILKGSLFPGATTAATAAAAPGAVAGIPGVALPSAFAPLSGMGNFAGVPLAGLAPPAADAAGAGLADAGGTAAADLGGTAAADAAGSVGADLAASAPLDLAATAAAPAAADATGMTLADLLPFLFAA